MQFKNDKQQKKEKPSKTLKLPGKQKTITKVCQQKHLWEDSHRKKTKWRMWKIPRTRFSMVYKSIANITPKASKCSSEMSRYQLSITKHQ